MADERGEAQEQSHMSVQSESSSSLTTTQANVYDPTETSTPLQKRGIATSTRIRKQAQAPSESRLDVIIETSMSSNTQAAQANGQVVSTADIPLQSGVPSGASTPLRGPVASTAYKGGVFQSTPLPKQ